MNSDVELSVIVPAYNEAAIIARTISSVTRYLREHHPAAELIVVDDGSSDATLQILEELREENGLLRVLTCGTNRGKGYAVRLGVANSWGEHVAFFDADLSYPLEALEPGLALLRTGADVVVGSRDATPARAAYPVVRRVATRVFNELVEQVLHLGVPDTQCGFKMFRGEVARRLFAALRLDGFSFDVELLYLARRWGLRVERLPIEMTHGSRSAVRLVRDGARMLRDVVKLGWIDKGPGKRF